MKYITRINSGSTHCYWVRVGYCIKEKVQKSFPDALYGGKAKALVAAKAWRNKKEKLLKSKIKKHKDDLKIRQWGDGISLKTDKRKTPPSKHWQGFFWDRKLNKQVTKTFSVNKYGYRKAKLLAKQWRKFKLTGKL